MNYLNKIYFIHALVANKCTLHLQSELPSAPQQKPEVVQQWHFETPYSFYLLFFLTILLHQEKGWFPVLQAFVVYIAQITWSKKEKRKKKNFRPQFQLVFPIIREKLDLHNMSMDWTSNGQRHMCAVTTGASLCPEWMVWYRLTRLHVSMPISVCAHRVGVCVNPAQHTCLFVSRELGEEPLSSLWT